jgi:hypothetical protein
VTDPWFGLLRNGSREQVLARLAEQPELARAVEPEWIPALFVAVAHDDPVVVEAMLRHGASAAEGFPRHTMELPWTGVPTIAVPVTLDYPIAFARSLPMLLLLIEGGAELRHARLRSVLGSGREAVEFLLAGGIEPDANVLREAPLELLPRLAEVSSATVLEQALREACQEDRREVVEILLAGGVSLESGEALAGAAAFDHVVLVRRLLEQGADPDATLPDGSTALIEAAFEGAEASALLLLDAGARPNRSNRFGQTALDGARESGAERLAARLVGE